MSIGTAIQKAQAVVVYDTGGQHLFSKTGNLFGYTCQSVTIGQTRGRMLTIYDEAGHRLTTVPGPTPPQS